MKKTALLIFLAIIALAVDGARAQTKTPEEAPSLLYKISGKGITRPSYIFGTFHAICPTEMVPFSSLDPYLTRTDQMIMEIDMDDAGEMSQMTSAVLIPGGKTIKDYLTAEEFLKVDEMTKELLGYPAENVKMIKPVMLSVMALTSPKAIGCTPTIYDLSLMQTMAAKKKPIVGLETVAEQIRAIDSRPLEKQAKDLFKVAEDREKAIKALRDLMATYKMADPEKIIEETNRQLKDDREFEIKLLDERNAAWIPKLESAFKEKATFVAVGAAHLGGKKGLLQLLRAKGYEVKPVKL